MKATQALRRAMREEDEKLGVSDGMSTEGTETPNPIPAGESFDVDVEDQPELSEEDEPQTKNEVPHNNAKVSDSNRDSKAEDAQVDLTSTTNGPELVDQEDSDAELEDELDKLFLGTGRSKSGHTQPSNADKPKIGAAKAKRQKRAEKQAALEAEGKAPPKSRKNRKHYNPSAAMQKARGETVTTGKKVSKKK